MRPFDRTSAAVRRRRAYGAKAISGARAPRQTRHPRDILRVDVELGGTGRRVESVERQGVHVDGQRYWVSIRVSWKRGRRDSLRQRRLRWRWPPDRCWLRRRSDPSGRLDSWRWRPRCGRLQRRRLRRRLRRGFRGRWPIPGGSANWPRRCSKLRRDLRHRWLLGRDRFARCPGKLARLRLDSNQFGGNQTCDAPLREPWLLQGKPRVRQRGDCRRKGAVLPTRERN